MTSADYLIESDQPLSGWMLPLAVGRQVRVKSRGLAVALAAKNFAPRSGQEIRVVHVPTGEVVFRKKEGRPEAVSDEA